MIFHYAISIECMLSEKNDLTEQLTCLFTYPSSAAAQIFPTLRSSIHLQFWHDKTQETFMALI